MFLPPAKVQELFIKSSVGAEASCVVPTETEQASVGRRTHATAVGAGPVPARCVVFIQHRTQRNSRAGTGPAPTMLSRGSRLNIRLDYCCAAAGGGRSKRAGGTAPLTTMDSAVKESAGSAAPLKVAEVLKGSVSPSTARKSEKVWTISPNAPFGPRPR